MSLIRFDNAKGRGPSGALWAGVVDWTKGVNTLDDGSGYLDDFTPYKGDAVGITLSGDGGVSAALQSDERHGVVKFTASSTADSVTGYQAEQYIDLDDDDFKLFCTEARLKSNDDDATTETFIGLSDEALDGFWGTDNTPDGSSIGVLWDGDETFDLVSIASNDTITTLAAAFATVVRTIGFIRVGVKIENQDGTNFLVTGSVTSGSGTSAKNVTKAVTTSTIPGAAMKPTYAHTNDNESAPDFEVDWYAYVDKGT